MSYDTWIAERAGESLPSLPTAEFIDSAQFSEAEQEAISARDWQYIDVPAYFVRSAAVRIAKVIGRPVMLTEQELTAGDGYRPTGESFMVEAEQ